MAFGDVIKKAIKVKVGGKGQDAKKDQLVAVDRKIDELTGERAAEMADYNARLKEQRKQRKALLDTIENGVEEVEIDVVERLNDQTGHVEAFRADNNKIIPELTRSLTAEERQLDIMDLDPKGTGKTPPPAKAKAGRKPGPAKSKGRGKGRAAAGAE